MENIMDGPKVKTLESLLIDSIEILVERVMDFEESLLNEVPIEGSWTGGQVCDHVIKCLHFIDQIINDSSEPTKRNPEQYVPALKDMMEDMSSKGKSAPNLQPDDRHFTKFDIKESLTELEGKLLQDIQFLDLASTCSTMKFPGLGYVTRYELISFTAFHTKRHAIQLNNIYQVLIASENK